MKQLCFFFILLLPLTQAKSQDAPKETAMNKNYAFQSFLHGTNTLLDEYVVNGSVNYKALKEDDEELKSLLELVAKMDLKGFTKEDKNSFFVNAYNLLVINTILQNYPEKASPEKITGFFNEYLYEVKGEEISLNRLEEEYIVKENQKDPLLYFSLFKGGMHPIAPNFAYYPHQFEDRLNYKIETIINNDAFIEINDDYRVVYLSPIFKWHSKGTYKEARAFINKYRDQELPEEYAITYSDSEWKVEPFQQFLLYADRRNIPKIKAVEFADILKKSPKDIQVIDARSDKEFEVGHIKSAKKMDFATFSMRNVWMLKKDVLVVVCSATAKRANLLGKYLMNNGFTNVQSASLIDWMNEGYSLENKEGETTYKLHVHKRENMKYLNKGKGTY